MRAGSGKRAALGFAPHSGWAACVALGGDAREPLLLARERVELAAAGDAEAKQPYHAAEELPFAEAKRAIARFLADATKRARAGVESVATRVETAGYTLEGASILQASGRPGLELASILASHALIHGADGNHFRIALAAACAKRELPVGGVRERDLAARAESALRRSHDELNAHLAALGKGVGPPWGADQRRAALLAWLVLAA